jgi:hypothetical protein
VAEAGQGGGRKKGKAKGAPDPALIEGEIAEAERRLAALSEEMAKPEAARAPARLAELNEDYARTDERLRSLYEEWERSAAEAPNA